MYSYPAASRFWEISNPTMDAYFKRCAGRDDGNTLGDTTIDKVTETLKSLCTVPSACCEKQNKIC